MYIVNKDTNKEAVHWRRDNKLQSIFRKLALQKGTKYKSYNFVAIQLELEDIDFIISNIPNKTKYAEVIELLNKCKFIIKTGGNLIYDSWW